MNLEVGVDEFAKAILLMSEKAQNLLLVLHVLEGFVDEEQLLLFVGVDSGRGFRHILYDIQDCIARVQRKKLSAVRHEYFFESKEVQRRCHHKLREHLRPAVYHVLVKSHNAPEGEGHGNFK